jgi:CheY-like chemotaxis protein
MPGTKANLLIVDDEPGNRTSLSSMLMQLDYRVRSVEDGQSALDEIGVEVPDILLTDLHMPGMSGFELLAVVRRRFPCLRTIAMSGAFRGNEIPSGVDADAFYQKGSGVERLLTMIEAPAQRERMGVNFASARPADQELLTTFGPGQDCP